MTLRFFFSQFLGLTIALTSFAAEKPLTAELHDRSGKSMGTAEISSEKGELLLSVHATGLRPGAHGIHIHSAGKCEGPDFKSAGPHLARAGQMHGIGNPKGHHSGDMPNLNVGGDGKAEFKQKLGKLTLVGSETSICKKGGTSLIIHDKVDDQKTDPSGNSGDRIACAVLCEGK